jgi:redox-sensitive bicupin YhaK (pirin superfamily)
MLAGRMRHEDHLGNVGLLGAGDVQWMTAGRGIIQSEMPQQESGSTRAFQLWLNLPAAKTQPAAYRDIPATDIPRFDDGAGLTLKVIAGEWSQAGVALRGPVNGTSTQPVFSTSACVRAADSNSRCRCATPLSQTFTKVHCR